uniref:coiled-coil domain-containing protein 117-like isoform X2 n=1 Tax=Myxine glutinosa TaxID=7769 RepID=UPI00358F24B0
MQGFSRVRPFASDASSQKVLPSPLSLPGTQTPQGVPSQSLPRFWGVAAPISPSLSTWGLPGAASGNFWQNQVPQNMPWGRLLPAEPLAFTGTQIPPAFQLSCKGSSILRRKRRKPSEEDAPHSKQFLSEDAMACKLHSLSLDNDHAYGSTGFPDCTPPPTTTPPVGSPPRHLSREGICKYRQWEEAYRRFRELEGRLEEEDEEDEDCGSIIAKENLVDEGLYDMADVPVVMLSNALKDQLHHISSDEITQKVIHAMNRPCMELVVWQPPESILKHCKDNIDKFTSTTDCNSQKIPTAVSETPPALEIQEKNPVDLGTPMSIAPSPCLSYVEEEMELS